MHPPTWISSLPACPHPQLGTTNPDQSAPGSIRGDFCIVTGKNIIHGSDSADSAAHEIQMWFNEKELNTWTPAESVWLYDAPKK